MNGEWLALIFFNLVVVLLLAIDLWLFHRRKSEMKAREALIATALWVALALAFSLAIFQAYEHHWGGLGLEGAHRLDGRAAAMQYLTGYVIELSLSVDNLFVFLAIFRYFHVRGRGQHRVLFLGIVAAILLRAVLIFAGVALTQRFEWLFYLLGLFLLFTAGKLAFGGESEEDPARNPVLKLARRWLPVAEGQHGDKLFVKERGRRLATSLFLVLIVVNVTDVVFATDSIPAILAISRDPFLIYSSNFAAILGLRSLYFALAGVIGLFAYLRIGLAAVLAFVGVKMLIERWVPISTAASLLAVGGLLAASILASILFPPRAQQRSD